MNPPDVNNPSPWHAGEKHLQERAGVAERMEVFGRRVIRDHMPEQHRVFYQQLPFDMKQGWKECEPLREIPEGRTIQSENYKPWSSPE